MSTTPVLSVKATELFVAGFGHTNLEMFLAADVTELFHEHVIEEDEAQAQAIGQIPAEATIADVVTLLEGIAGADAPVADAPAPVAPVVEAPAQPAPATPEVVAEVAQNVAAATGIVPEAPASLAAAPAVLDASNIAPLQPDWVAGLSPNAQTVKHAFDDYVAKMRPRAPVTVDDISRNQAVLAHTLTSVINRLDGDDFHLMFNYVLQQFKQHAEGVFRPVLVNRGMDLVPLAPEALRLFQRLINMFTLLADPATREVAHRQIDLAKTLAGAISEPGRQRVFQFFGL